MNVLIVALDAAIPAKVPDAEVLVVAPALNSWLRHWLSDEDAARRRAEERVAACVDRLQRSGVHAEGRVGDADPLLAIADASPTFPATRS
jgi:nucleotide-binding universal stress UspA family protein